MTDKTARRTHLRPYAKPQLEQVELVAEEAVLQACKAGQYVWAGPCGTWSFCGKWITLCKDSGS